MNKLMICLAFLLQASHILYAQDTTRLVSKKLVDTAVHVTDTIPKSMDTVKRSAMATRKDPSGFSAVVDTIPKSQDTSSHLADSTLKTPSSTAAVKDTLPKSQDTAQKAAVQTAPPAGGDVKLVVDKSDPAEVGTAQDWDTRWFISPLFKFQLMDFGIIEKSHLGSLSNANKLPLMDRSNVSAALSIYKNISGHFSASADIGLSYGHVTSSQVPVGTTTPKTFNLLNATVFYHLLGAQHKLQPFVSVGINDLVNDASYLTAPVGAGLKYHANKFMVIAQAAYGYGLSKNMASTTMYNLCFYVPINTKKKKDNTSTNSADSKASSKDSTAKANKDLAINKKDSLAGKPNADSSLNAALKSQLVAANKADSTDSFSDEKPNEAAEANASGKGLKTFNYQDFSKEDFQVDTVDGKALVRFVIYFEFNQYDLNSSAFDRIDKVISRVRADKTLMTSIKGYTDNVGSNEFNIFLSKKRAQIVFDYMNSRGVPSDRISAKYFGKENPVADNNNPNTAWLNRRAEIVIKEKDSREMPAVKLPMPRNLRK